MSNNKLTHYQVQQELQRLEGLGLTREMVKQYAPQLEQFYDDPSVVKSSFQNLANRAGELAVNATEFTGKGVEYLTGSDVMQQVADSMQGAVDTYAPRSTFATEKFENEPLSVGNVYGLAASEGLSSVADAVMALSPTGRFAYGAAETNRIANERAESDGRSDANLQDYGIGALSAGANIALERVGGKYMFGLDDGAEFVGKNIDEAGDLLGYVANDKSTMLEAGKQFLKGGAMEGGTEFIQEGQEYIATNAGTQTGANLEDGLNQATIGATVGGVLGSHIRGAKTGYEGVTRQKLADQQTVDLLEQNQSSDLPGDHQVMQQYMPESEALSYEDAGQMPFDNRENSPLVGQEFEEIETQALNADYDVAQMVDAHPEQATQAKAYQAINNQTEQYEQAKTALADIDQSVLNEATQDQLNRQNISPSQNVSTEQLGAYRQSLRPNVMHTLAKGQMRQQEKQEQQASNKAERNANFNQHVKNENAVKVKSLATNLKAKHKRYAKQVKKAIADKKIAQQSKDFDIRFNERLKKFQESVKAIESQRLREEYDKTQLARQYQLAEQIGIEKDFSALHLALTEALGNNPDTYEIINSTVSDFVENEANIQQQLVGDDGTQYEEHVTRSGNSIVGLVDEALSKDEAKAIDPNATPKDGGWFVSRNKLELFKQNLINNTQAQNEVANEALDQVGDDGQRNNGTGSLESGSLPSDGSRSGQRGGILDIATGTRRSGDEDLSMGVGRNDNDNALNEIDAKAHEAATSPLNDLAEPTQGQKEAGNYKKGKVKLHGMDISIENPKGSVRSGVSPDGKEWSNTIHHHYGDIKGTNGADNDPIDVFIGENPDSEKVFVVDQVDPDSREFDEHKVMMGFDNLEDAKSAYLMNYEDGWTGLANITEVEVSKFKEWIKKPRKSKQPFYQAKETAPKQGAVSDQGEVKIKAIGKAWLVHGDTFPIKDEIRSAGGAWNKKHQGWIFPNSKKDLAESFATNLVEKPSGSVEKKSTEKVDNPVNNQNTSIYRELFKLVENSTLPKNNIELKKWLGAHLGKPFNDVSLADQKVAQEALEAAMTHYARKIAKLHNKDPKRVVETLTRKYEKQPNLNVKTATSATNMAYSTPAPISYLVNKVAGINDESTVYEPTAGNGLLLITNELDNTRVNELDPKRIQQLEWLGYSNISDFDATSDRAIVKAKSKDVVIMNPPFGKFDKPFMADSVDGLEYKLEDIDHIIAAKQLEAMKDNGSAILILGANKEPGIVRKGKSGRFLNWLYRNYNVVDHVELDGKVYTKQGAEWPIRIIAIHGRKDTGIYAPTNGTVERLTGDNASDIIFKLYDRYANNGLLDPTERGVNRNTGTSDTDLQTGSGKTSNSRVNSSDGKQQDLRSTNESKSSPTSRQAGSSEQSHVERDNGQVVSDQRDKQSSDRVDAKTGSRSGKQELESASSTRSEKSNNRVKSKRNAVDVARDLERESDSDKSNAFQSNYRPASSGFNENVLTPVNMASKTRKALAKLTRKVGDLDSYLANKLEYDSIEELHKAFMALQVDAVSLAIDKIENGKAIVIADQTGVGKGRQAAAIIRYAHKHGKTPVFISQKANLFSDMFGDLADIGSTDIKPFIFNDGESITANGETLFKSFGEARKAGLTDLAQGNMPTLKDGETANALFLTYDQISVPNKQREALLAMAENAVLVLDESHTAAGQDAKRGIFLRGLLEQTQGAMYLSATYAKRPDNLGLYHLTSLGDAVENMDELQEALGNGGLQLQTLVSSMMSEEGELIRRERSFDGIQINSVVDVEHKAKHAEMFDKSTEILRDIVRLGKGFVHHIKAVNKQNKSGSEFKANTNVDKLNPFMFSSVVHNYIAQLTMAIKSESAAYRAIDSLKQGKKPVIALESTLESKLDEYMASSGLSIGDSVDGFSFGDMFETGLLNSISLSEKLPNGQTKKVPFSFSELPTHLQKQYQEIKRKIAKSDFSDIPVSPIDKIRQMVEEAGYSVAEVTGRGKMIDYSDDMKVINKPANESKANRRKVIDRFNSGKLDVLILNQSGSTGLSAHASEKFSDQRPRHMVVAQPSLDINTFMQMLGRINRTGQVELPSFDVLWLDLPSENRPATVVSNKMKGLNANTSANTDSATSIESMDMFNVYGDEIIEGFLTDNPDFMYEMAIDNLPETDKALFVTGKLALLPVARQEEFYSEVEPAYKEHVEHLKKTGEYALETQELDLDAKPIEQSILAEGEGKSVFDGDIKLTLTDSKSQGKPPSPDDAKAVFENADREAIKTLFKDAKAQFNKYITKKYDDKIDKLQSKLAKANEDKKAALENDIDSLKVKKQKELAETFELEGMLNHRMVEGSTVKFEFADGELVYGVIKKVRHSFNGKGNPLAKSKFKVSILTASGLGTLDMPMSKLVGDKSVLKGLNEIGRSQILSLFRSEFNRPQREKRYIVTGNLIKAFSMLADGRVVQFSKNGGGSEIGILLPKKFKPEHVVKKDYARTFNQVKKYMENVNDDALRFAGVENQDGFRIGINGKDEVYVNVPVNNANNRAKYLNDDMLKLFGKEPTWRKGAKVATVTVSMRKAKSLFEYVKDVAPFALTGTQLEKFNEINKIDGDFKKATGTIFFSKSDASVTKGKLPKGITLSKLEKVVEQLKADYKGALPEFYLRATQAEIYGPENAITPDRIIKGGITSRNGKWILPIASETQENLADLRATLRHEIVGHYGFQSLAESVQKQIENRLIASKGRKEFRELWQRLDNDSDYKDFTDQEKAQEVFAYTIETDTTSLQKLKDTLLDLVLKGLRAIGLLNKEVISKTELRALANRIARKIKSGKFTPPTPPNDGGTSYRKSGDKRSNASKLAESFRSAIDTFGFKAVLKVMPINQVADIYDHLVGGAIGRYYDLLEDMAAYKQKAMSWADINIEEKWDELQSKSPEANKRMSNTMLNATMAQVSPDLPLNQQTKYQDLSGKLIELKSSINDYGSATKKQSAYYDSLEQQLSEFEDAYNEIQKDWFWLKKNSPEAITLYKKVRKTYKTMWEKTKKHLMDRIAELEANDKVKSTLMAKIKLQFEKALTHGDYFPLSRFGDFAVVGRKGTDYIREQYDTKKEADKAAREMESEGYTTAVRKLSTAYDSSGQMDAFKMGADTIASIQDMVEAGNAQIEQELKSAQSTIQEVIELARDMGTIEATGLIDAIYQTMLQSLPQASAAKHFIHRNRVKGASNDMRRGFAHSIFHSIQRAAKIQFEHKLQNQLSHIATQANEMTGTDQTRVRDIHDSLNERHQKTMNPDGSPTIAQFTGMGFNYFLGGSIAAGLVNMSQVPLVAAPYFASKHGISKTTKAIQKAYGLMFGSKLSNKGSLLKTLTQADAWIDVTKSGELNQADKDLLITLQERGKIDVTQAHSLSQIADTETIGDKGRNRSFVKLQRAWGFAFHNAEVVNRQVTALVSIDLARQKGISDNEELIKIASKAIDETQFNYAGHNRGMAFRSDLGKLVFMFKTYVANMMILMAKSTYRATKGDKEAASLMGYMMALHFTAAGAIGLPAVEVLGDLIFNIKDLLDDDDEEDDFKLWLDESIQYSVELLGGEQDTAKAVSTFARKGAFNSIVGVNVADRVGLNNLLWRSEYSPEATAHEKVANILYGLSPITAIASGVLDGVNTLTDGIAEGDAEKVVKGLEKPMPVALKNIVKSIRQQTYGLTTRSGTDVVTADQFNVLDSLYQAIGFSSEKVRDTYERRGQQYKIEGAAKLRKKALMRKAARAIESGSLSDSITSDIARFNRDNPSTPITADGIIQHIENKQLRNSLTKNGIYKPKSRQNEVGKYHYYED